jgi:hypothetical protein
MPAILAAQEAEIRKIMVKASLDKEFSRLYVEKPFTKIGLVQWLNVKDLSSSPSTTKKVNVFPKVSNNKY